MPTDPALKSQKKSGFFLRFNWYNNLPFSHTSFSLGYPTGRESFYSFNAATEEENKKLSSNMDYVPTGELSYLPPDDLSTSLYQFYKRQIAPMISYKAALITDAHAFPKPEKSIVLPVTESEFLQAKCFVEAQEEAIAKGQLKYSIVHRSDGSTVHHSCASLGDELLNQVARDGEKELLALSELERISSSHPSLTQKRAENIANHRNGFFSSRNNDVDEHHINLKASRMENNR